MLDQNPCWQRIQPTKTIIAVCFLKLKTMGRYIKWIDGKDICVADLRSDTIANYYRNGKLYAKLQKFIPQDSDTEITEEEFNNLTKK